MNAWFLTWEGTSPEITPENKIAAIISARRASSFVHEIADLLYARSMDPAYDVARAANSRSHHRSELTTRFGVSDGFYFGRDLFIFARRVSGLSIKRDEPNGIETITWIDPPYLRVLEAGELPIIGDPARRCTLIRPVRAPLSKDLELRARRSPALSRTFELVTCYTCEPIT
jgi:hypothetical protein